MHGRLSMAFPPGTNLPLETLPEVNAPDHTAPRITDIGALRWAGAPSRLQEPVEVVWALDGAESWVTHFEGLLDMSSWDPTVDLEHFGDYISTTSTEQLANLQKLFKVCSTKQLGLHNNDCILNSVLMGK